MVAQSGDKCKLLLWVFYHFEGIQFSLSCCPGFTSYSDITKDSDQQVYIGKIEKILVPFGASDKSASGVILLACYSVSLVRDAQLNMPVLEHMGFIDVVPSKVSYTVSSPGSHF
jgi:hypothetical protein